MSDLRQNEDPPDPPASTPPGQIIGQRDPPPAPSRPLRPVPNTIKEAIDKDDRETLGAFLNEDWNNVNRNIVLYEQEVGQEVWTLLCYAIMKGRTEIARFLVLVAGADVNHTTRPQAPLFIASEYNNVPIVRLLIDEGADVNQTNQNNGDTPLFIASEYNHVEIARLLIDRGADPNKANNNGMTPLYIASRWDYIEIVRLLLAAPGIDVNKTRNDGETPLFAASTLNHIEIVKLLLAAGADVNQAENSGQTPLFAASAKRHTEIVKLLLAAPGIDVNQAKNNGMTPLYIASFKGEAECVSLLLAAPGIDVNQANNYGITPLHKASARNHTEIVKLLLAAPGIDVNKADNNGITPLYKASWAGLVGGSGRVEVVKLLLADPRVDVNKCYYASANNDYVDTPLFAASKKNHIEIVKLLLAKEGINVNQALYDTPLIGASQEGHTDVVKLLLAAGADVNKQRSDVKGGGGETPLYFASCEGHTEVVRLLLAAPGIEVNESIGDGDSALFAASQLGKTDVVRLLLAAPGINVNQATDGGNTPLHIASAMGHYNIVKLLLAATGIRVNLANNNGKTPLWIASRKGYYNIIELLLAAEGIDVNQPDNDGKTPLYIASEEGHIDAIKKLLAAPGIDVNETSENGHTPLCIASEYGRAGIAELLLAKGADVNKAYKGVSPLYIASRYGHAECVSLLLAKGADVNKRLDDGMTPLYIASAGNHPEVVDLLLAAPGIDVNKAREGITPLWIASYENNVEIVRSLLAAPGIDVNQDNVTGETPLWIAMKQGWQGSRDLLLADSRVDVNKADIIDGNTPLHIAILWRWRQSCLTILSDSRVDVNKANNNGDTPLIGASQDGNVEVVEMLLAREDIEMELKAWQALVAAAKEHHFKIFLLLLKDPRTIVPPDLTEDNIVEMASNHASENLMKVYMNLREDERSEEIMCVLKSEGKLQDYKDLEYIAEDSESYDINNKNDNDRNALIVAALNGYEDIVKYILTSDAHLDLLKEGVTAIDGKCSIDQFRLTKLGNIQTLIADYKEVGAYNIKAVAKKIRKEALEKLKELKDQPESKTPDFDNLDAYLGKYAELKEQESELLPYYRLPILEIIIRDLRSRDLEIKRKAIMAWDQVYDLNKITYTDTISQMDEIEFPVRCLCPGKHVHEYGSLHYWFNIQGGGGYDMTLKNRCPQCNAEVEEVEFMSSALIRRWQYKKMDEDRAEEMLASVRKMDDDIESKIQNVDISLDRMEHERMEAVANYTTIRKMQLTKEQEDKLSINYDEEKQNRDREIERLKLEKAKLESKEQYKKEILAKARKLAEESKMSNRLLGNVKLKF